MNFLEEIKLYQPQGEQEKRQKEIMLHYIVMFYDTISYRHSRVLPVSASARRVTESLAQFLWVWLNVVRYDIQ